MKGTIIDHHIDLFQLFPVEGHSCLFCHFAQEGLIHHGHHFQHLFRGETDTGRESLFQKFGGKSTVLKIELLCDLPYLICRAIIGQAIGVALLCAGRPVIKSVVVFFPGQLLHMEHSILYFSGSKMRGDILIDRQGQFTRLSYPADSRS